MADSPIASLAVQIDQKTISATVERIVLQEIAAKLGDPGIYFERVIQACVMTKVDDAGNPTNSSYHSRTLIEHTAQKAVGAFAREIVHSWLEKNKPALEKAIVDALKRNVGTMAKAMADAADSQTTWGNVEITIAHKDKR